MSARDGSGDTARLYDAHAGRWRRRGPSSLSDFTGRPPVFELCGDVTGLDVLDLGSGEGYCSRELASRGARSAAVMPTIQSPRLTATMEQLEQKMPSVFLPSVENACNPTAQKLHRTLVRWALMHMPRSSTPAP